MTAERWPVQALRATFGTPPAPFATGLNLWGALVVYTDVPKRGFMRPRHRFRTLALGAGATIALAGPARGQEPETRPESARGYPASLR